MQRLGSLERAYSGCGTCNYNHQATLLIIVMFIDVILLTGCGGSSSKSSGEGDLASGQEGTIATKRNGHVTIILQIWLFYLTKYDLPSRYIIIWITFQSTVYTQTYHLAGYHYCQFSWGCIWQLSWNWPASCHGGQGERALETVNKELAPPIVTHCRTSPQSVYLSPFQRDATGPWLHHPTPRLPVVRKIKHIAEYSLVWWARLFSLPSCEERRV